MRQIRLITLIALLFVSIVALPVQAQTPTPTSPSIPRIYMMDSGWSFHYPYGWEVVNFGDSLVIGNTDDAITHGASNSEHGDLFILMVAGDTLVNSQVIPGNRDPSDVMRDVLRASELQSSSQLTVGTIEDPQLGDLAAAEVEVTEGRDEQLQIVLVRYQADFWVLLLAVAPYGELDDWRPTVNAMAASFVFPASPQTTIAGSDADTPNIYSTTSPQASFKYPDGWVAQGAGEDGVTIATSQDILSYTPSDSYTWGDARIFVRINSAKQLAQLMNLDIGEDASPLKFLQAEVKAARSVPGSNLSDDDKPAATTLDGKPAATIVIHTDNYAEEILYIEYTPGVILRMEITAAPQELAKQQLTALSILESVQYTEPSQ